MHIASPIDWMWAIHNPQGESHEKHQFARTGPPSPMCERERDDLAISWLTCCAVSSYRPQTKKRHYIIFLLPAAALRARAASLLAFAK